MSINRTYVFAGAIFAVIFGLASSGLHPVTGNGGYTGAPGESTCATCHSGNNPNIDGDISVSGLPSTIITGQTYPLTITITNPNGNATRAGFQMVLLNGVNGNAGNLTGNSTGTQLRNSGGKSYLGHAPATNFPASNEINFTVNWTAPATAGSNPVIKLFAVSVIANGNNGSSGDRVALSSFEVPIENAPAPLSATINNIASTLCSNSADGSASAVPSGGNGPYSYVWNNGATTQVNSSLPSGPASVTVTDNNGATATASANIPSPPSISLNATASPACNNQSNGSASAAATGGLGGFTYFWSNGTTGPVITGLSPGTYTVTVSDVNGCSKTASAAVQNSNAINIVPTISTVSCNGGTNGSIQVSVSGGSGGFAYLWSTGNTTPTLNGIPAGSYGVTVTDAQGCTTAGIYAVTEPPALQLSPTFTNVLCFGSPTGAASAVTSGGTPSYSFIWSSGQTTQSITGLSAGNYSMTVTDSKGCQKNSSIAITQPDALILELSSSDTLLCPGESNGFLEVSTSGGTGEKIYLWSNGSSDNGIEGLSAGSYVVTVTDANACIRAAAFSVVSTAVIIISLDSIENVGCYGDSDGAILTNISGGYQSLEIEWSNGIQNVEEVTNLPAGSYNVIVVDDAGCMVTDSFSVTQPEQLTVEIEVNNESETGSSDGSILALPAGGAVPYSILWSHGDESFSPDSLTAGLYTYTITDANACALSGQVVVNANNCIIGVEALLTQPLCFNSSDGEIELVFDNPDDFYEIKLFKNQIEWMNPLDSLSPGSYTVQIEDTTGCLAVLPDLILLPVSPEIFIDSILVQPASGPDKSDGRAEISVSGGTGALNAAWFLGDELIAEGTSVSGLAVGTYSVLITDDVGCSITDSIQIGIQSALNPIYLKGDIVLFPNPVVDECTIMNPFSLPLSRVDCFDQNGQIKASQEIITNFPSIKFQKSELGIQHSGIYLIRLWIGDTPIYKKIMVLHSND